MSEPQSKDPEETTTTDTMNVKPQVTEDGGGGDDNDTSTAPSKPVHDEESSTTTTNATDPSKEKPTENEASSTNTTTNAQPVSESTPEAEAEPSYESTKESTAYVGAKALLADGDFESALEMVGDALSGTLKLVGGDELHGSLAPLYYLYGTTLLYAVEESGDAMVDTSAEAVASSGENVPATVNAPTVAAADAEDVQVAWENLESARNILETLLTKEPNPKRRRFVKDAVMDENGEGDGDAKSKLCSARSLDLAQVHRRLGDLQKGNGNYAGAVEDYRCSLSRRVCAYGRFGDRSIADAHYSLGTVHLMAATAGEGSSGDADKSATATAPSPSKSHFHRRRSALHFVSCGMVFGVLVGSLCGVSEEDVLSCLEGVDLDGTDLRGRDDWWDDDDDDTDRKRAALSKFDAKAFLATNGKEGFVKPDETTTTIPWYSVALTRIRERVKDLKAVDVAANGAVVFDIKEVLDEIQETVDSSEESLRVVHDLAQQKTAAAAAAEREDKKETTTENCATPTGATTIGFGTATSTATGTGITTIGFGSSASSSAATATATVMAVKKKKKRPCPSPTSASNATSNGDADATHGSPSKRSKTVPSANE